MSPDNKKIVECIPNFSEGRNREVIFKITSAIESVKGIRILHIDSGITVNRTVVTFIGGPDEVCEAAYRAIKRASELIDMSAQNGSHPRIGATDVCPLVPVSNVSMEETIELAHKLANRVGNDLGIPVYCYEHAAFEEKRRNLANCRNGEYEGLKLKLLKEDWKPDYGAAKFDDKVVRTGATIIGARNFLIAYNINLNTTSVDIASEIAYEIRENGRLKREGGKKSGKIITDNNGVPKRISGKLKSVKGLGWYIEEYGVAQLTFNLTNIEETTIYQVYEEAKKCAGVHNVRVTGSEIIGLVPLGEMIKAGEFYIKKNNLSLNIPESKKVKLAIEYLGLNEFGIFNPGERIIDYLLANK